MHYSRIDLYFCILMPYLRGKIFLLSFGLNCQRFWKFYYGWAVTYTNPGIAHALVNPATYSLILCPVLLLPAPLAFCGYSYTAKFGVCEYFWSQVIVILLWTQGNSNKQQKASPVMCWMPTLSLEIGKIKGSQLNTKEHWMSVRIRGLSGTLVFL